VKEIRRLDFSSEFNEFVFNAKYNLTEKKKKEKELERK